MSVVMSRTDAAAAVNLVVDQGGGVPGLTVVVAVRDGVSTNSYLDFNDDTFKTSGWTTRQAVMADVGGGFYTLTGGLNVAAVTNLPSTSGLVLEYTITGALTAVAMDQVVLSEAETLMPFLHAVNHNKMHINLSTQKLELYDDAGTSLAKTWPLATNGGEPVTTQSGVQTKRGVQEI